jgi:hypothetical protein
MSGLLPNMPQTNGVQLLGGYRVICHLWLAAAGSNPEPSQASLNQVQMASCQVLFHLTFQTPAKRSFIKDVQQAKGGSGLGPL